ncbi:MAG: hypothetical protein WC015_04035 [Methanoregula sp.]
MERPHFLSWTATLCGSHRIIITFSGIREMSVTGDPLDAIRVRLRKGNPAILCRLMVLRHITTRVITPWIFSGGNS